MVSLTQFWNLVATAVVAWTAVDPLTYVEDWGKPSWCLLLHDKDLVRIQQCVPDSYPWTRGTLIAVIMLALS